MQSSLSLSMTLLWFTVTDLMSSLETADMHIHRIEQAGPFHPVTDSHLS